MFDQFLASAAAFFDGLAQGASTPAALILGVLSALALILFAIEQRRRRQAAAAERPTPGPRPAPAFPRRATAPRPALLPNAA